MIYIFSESVRLLHPYKGKAVLDSSRELPIMLSLHEKDLLVR